VLDTEGTPHDFSVPDFAYAAWRAQARVGETLPEPLRNPQVSPADQLLMQAALQPYVDGSISKTLMLPRSLARRDVEEIFRAAYDLRLKGSTVFREATRPAVIKAADTAESCDCEGR
jgi:ribonucleoside-diphosphate reductase alpha chain